ncbi:DUF4157 domain-containing protein [Algoriphagus sp.]|uniref:eCIS core domain-containing protein n=1 Tax=Algoriphagus sp. TaxID=1872435 RepID=UPI0025DDE2DE|nr:DUF4157 domain-containing protein [Algoriphagus sp.]
MALKNSYGKLKKEKAPIKGTFFQAKLAVNHPGDRYEQEADSVAEKVVNDINSDSTTPIMSSPNIQKKCAECEEENIQMKGSSSGGFANQEIESGIKSEAGTGKTLNSETRNLMESRFGADFGNIKIHDGSNSHQLNRKLNARAFTHQDDIFFNSGEYNPSTQKGKKLLAHELTHVIQQSTSPINKIQRDDDEASIPSPEEEESEFEFNYELLPPSLQFSLGQWMLEANTSRVALQFTQGLMQTRFGYNYGGNLTLGTSSPSGSAEIGFNPHSPAMSFGLTQDRFRFGANADFTTGGFGLNLGYGSRLLPMPFDLAGPVNSGWAGASGILGDIGSMQDPISFYQSHGDNIDQIMGAVKALQPLADEENQGFGAGLRFSYNPQTGVLIHAGVQWMF